MATIEEQIQQLIPGSVVTIKVIKQEPLHQLIIVHCSDDDAGDTKKYTEQIRGILPQGKEYSIYTIFFYCSYQCSYREKWINFIIYSPKEIKRNYPYVGTLFRGSYKDQIIPLIKKTQTTGTVIYSGSTDTEHLPKFINYLVHTCRWNPITE